MYLINPVHDDIKKSPFICLHKKLFCQGQFFHLVLVFSKHCESKSEMRVALHFVTCCDSKGSDKEITVNEVEFGIKFGETVEDYFASVCCAVQGSIGTS